VFSLVNSAVSMALPAFAAGAVAADRYLLLAWCSAAGPPNAAAVVE